MKETSTDYCISLQGLADYKLQGGHTKYWNSFLCNCFVLLIMSFLRFCIIWVLIFTKWCLLKNGKWLDTFANDCRWHRFDQILKHILVNSTMTHMNYCPDQLFFRSRTSFHDPVTHQYFHSSSIGFRLSKFPGQSETLISFRLKNVLLVLIDAPKNYIFRIEIVFLSDLQQMESDECPRF